MIIVVDVEKWLFVHKKEADEASIPTILVEKDIEGATWFTSMRILFQLKKWASQRQFIPLLSYNEGTYRSYEVFHVDAVPPMTLLDGGRTLLVNNQRDETYDLALQKSGHESEESVLSFAFHYIEQATGEDVVFAGNGTIDVSRVVPNELWDATNRLDSGRRLFEWMSEEDSRKENGHD
ncbi:MULTISPECIES: hypothetical protein [Exiguobacterium]|uniref:hypothetical protein n=1 Tax=Exiguobacterium TaxID=33986 RepID=UPI00047C1E82|nr:MULTISPECIES: hypothetical protein [Exiguobacterium]